MTIPKTPEDIRKALKGFFETNMTALQGMIDKLPESLRGDLVKLKDDLNAQLEKLRPIDQVPAAQDAHYAIEYLAGSIVRVQEYANDLMQRLTQMTKTLAEKQSAYQGFIDREKAGDLIAKEAAATLVAQAREDERKALLPQIVSLRKTQVELAGLPEADGATLELAADKFEAAFADAKANLAKLEKKGLKLKGRGHAMVTELCWKPAAECDGKLTAYADILGAPATAPEKRATGADPLLGSGGGGETKEPGKETLLAVL